MQLKFIMTRFRLGISDIFVHYYRYKRHTDNDHICPLYRVAQEREREREEKRREDNTLLHRDKDLSTCRLFCKSVTDDKHSNTQYIKQKFN